MGEWSRAELAEAFKIQLTANVAEFLLAWYEGDAELGSAQPPRRLPGRRGGAGTEVSRSRVPGEATCADGSGPRVDGQSKPRA